MVKENSNWLQHIRYQGVKLIKLIGHYPFHYKLSFALGWLDEARKAFVHARDEDVCPLRALTPVCTILEDIARTSNTGLVYFEGIVDENSPDGIPGNEFFLDHVHPTIEGNWLLALAIVKEMVHEKIVSPASTWNDAAIAEISEKLNSSMDEQFHAAALKNLSKVLGWAGKHDEAERLVNLAVTTNPEDGETYFQKGILLKKAGDNEAALVHYEEAVRLAPWNAVIRRGLGVLYSELGHPAEAAYRTALKLNPDHANAHNNLGITLAQRGNLTAAYKHFAEALRLDSNHKDGAANLACARKALKR